MGIYNVHPVREPVLIEASADCSTLKKTVAGGGLFCNPDVRCYRAFYDEKRSLLNRSITEKMRRTL